MKQKHQMVSREELASHHSEICLQLLGDYPSMIADMPQATLESDTRRLLGLVGRIRLEIDRRAALEKGAHEHGPADSAVTQTKGEK